MCGGRVDVFFGPDIDAGHRYTQERLKSQLLPSWRKISRGLKTECCPGKGVCVPILLSLEIVSVQPHLFALVSGCWIQDSMHLTPHLVLGVTRD